MSDPFEELIAAPQCILRRDGVVVCRGTELELWSYIHRNHSYSVSHALQYEGYSIEYPKGRAW